MTIPVSSVPGAKAWLLGRLQATLTDDGTATFGVQYGPFGTQNPADMVWLGDTQNRQAVPWTMQGNLTGAGTMQESYDLTVNIFAYRGSDQAQTAEQRAFTLLAGVEDVVRTDPTFGNLLIRSYPNAVTATVDWDEEFKGRLCSIPLTISCLAQL